MSETAWMGAMVALAIALAIALAVYRERQKPDFFDVPPPQSPRNFQNR